MRSRCGRTTAGVRTPSAAAERTASSPGSRRSSSAGPAASLGWIRGGGPGGPFRVAGCQASSCRRMRLPRASYRGTGGDGRSCGAPDVRGGRAGALRSRSNGSSTGLTASLGWRNRWTAKRGAGLGVDGCGLWLVVRVNIFLLLLASPLPRHLFEDLDRTGDAQHRFPELFPFFVELGEHALAGFEFLAQLGEAGFDLLLHRPPLGEVAHHPDPPAHSEAGRGDPVLEAAALAA